MKGHVSDVQIRSYRAQALATAELLEVSDHLASCEACRVRMASPVELRTQVSAIQSLLETKTASGHLPYDEIAAYVDGQMASETAARVELHARECQSCASTLEDLRILRAELQAEPPRRWRWHHPTWSTWFSGRPVWQGGLAQALGQGTRYSWQIHMRRGGAEITIPAPPAPEARFRILEEDERAEVARARGRWGDSHLIMGVVYASAGLLDEADQELGLASSQNPDSQPLAALRARVEQLRASHGKQ
jgi:anti-sigma factor RsiW